MKNKILISLIAVLFTVNLTAQDSGYKLEFQVEGLKDTLVNLSYFFGSNFYFKDTTQVDSEGKFTFTGDEPLEEGMYGIIKGRDKLFDFFVDGQSFSMETELENIAQEMEIEGSKENEIFYEYLAYLKQKQKIAADLVEKQKATEEGSKEYEKLEKELVKLDNEVTGYIEDFKKKHKGSFTVKFLKAMDYPTLPKVEEGAKIDSAFQLQYLRKHAFDNIDFSDERMLRIPSYHEKVMYFMNSLTYSEPDSIINSIEYILDKAKENPEIFKYTLNMLTSYYQKSERMGTDAIFVHMANNYYLKGLAPWIGEKDVEKIRERKNALEPLLIGKIAPNIIVKDTAQEKTLSLYDVDAKYTIVYIWSPECGHCKVTTPELLEIYHKYKDKGVEVFAVGNEFENEAWLKFIRKHNLDWINGSDGKTFRSNFRSLYDVYSTPQTYLLDENKVIIAKKMTMESLDKILEYQMKQDEKKAVNEQ